MFLTLKKCEKKNLARYMWPKLTLAMSANFVADVRDFSEKCKGRMWPLRWEQSRQEWRSN